jgi:hypothetical protein
MSNLYLASKHTINALNLFKIILEVLKRKSFPFISLLFFPKLSAFKHAIVKPFASLQILLILFCFGAFVPQKSFANVTVTPPPSLTVYACGGAFPTAYSSLGSIVITEGVNTDFAVGSNVTLILTAPTNFEFQPGVGSAIGNGNSIGAFVTFSYDVPSGSYVPTPPNGTTNFIESGQAFLAQSFGGGTVTIIENSKEFSTTSMIFRTSRQDAQLRTNLYAVNTDKTLLDGTLNQFSINGNNAVDGKDALKIPNIAAGTYMGIMRDGRNLTIERRQLINMDDTIFYNITTLTRRNYQLEFIAANLNQDITSGYLEDSYLKTKTPVSLTGTTTVNFTVNTDPASAVPNRFRIVFQGSPKAVTFTKLQVSQQDNDIAVDWAVTNEVNIRSYDVEISGNGQQFVKSATVDAKGNDYSNEHYQWLDVNAKPGVYYYRIRSTNVFGEIQYSKEVKVIVTRGRSDIKVYPNPVVVGKINVQMINQPAGNYTIRLINGLGQVMLSKQIVHQEGSSIETIMVSKNMVDENYRLEVTKPDKSRVSMNVLLQ